MHSPATISGSVSPGRAFTPSAAHTAAVTVTIPTPLRNCSAGKSELALSAIDLRAVLIELETRYPALHRSICDETGKVRQHINLWVNNDHMRERNGLDTQLTTGDIITIMTAVSGG